MLDIAIIGGGLSGLSLAKRLMNSNSTIAVFESSDRFGGRIFSLPVSNADNDSTFQTEARFRHDLGPSWIWPESQPHMARFIVENDIKIYSQWSKGKTLYQTDKHDPPQAYDNYADYYSAFRIDGGTYRLVETLLQQLPPEILRLNHHLLEVINHKHHIELLFTNNSKNHITVKSKRVVITIPPRLLVNTVWFNPVLDIRLRELMDNTVTWMAGHAKVVIQYQRAFWRDANYSGNAMANYRGAALAEIFDVCSTGGEYAALSGFFALPARMRSKYRADLEALILDQLVRLFGKQAADPTAILIKDWFDEPLTATTADQYPPDNHPHYGHTWLQLEHWDDKLLFGGTETASRYGGYLEGALESTERAARSLSI